MLNSTRCKAKRLYSEENMEERVWINLLMDFYGGLLTKHQRDTLELYLMEDLSLGEIAEETGITRQGVRDAIVRGKAALNQAEENAGIVKRYLEFRERMEEVRAMAEGNESLITKLDAAMEIWEGE
ncbi:MAG: DNA-binding protein [Clostridiales bacterium]|nr:DNA-binding protein [Clostridiales bacterium]